MPNPFFADLVRELAQEGGTGPLTPTGAVPGHRRFADAVPPGVSFHYAVAGIARPEQWEVGTGRIGGDGRLLRDMVAASSADGAAVDFAPGLKTIALTIGAGWFAASETRSATLASGMAALGGELAGLADAIEAKQPLSTTHGSASAGEATDAVTVRRGAGWVNIPLSTLAFRDAEGDYALDGALGVRRPVDGDVLDVGKDGGQRLRVFADAGAVGLFNVANAGAGRDGLRILDGAVAVDIAAREVGRFGATGVEFTMPNGGRMFAEQAGSSSVKLRSSATLQYEVATASSHQFFANGAQVAQIGPVNFGIGAGAPAALVHVRGGGGGATQLRLDSSATQPNIAFYNGSGNMADRNWALAASFTSFGDFAFRRSTASGGDPLTGVTAFRLLGTGEVVPGADNVQPIGSASFRWSAVYASSGTINTSDAREKAWCSAASEAELRAARRIIDELGFFQWNDAIALKGTEGARLHFGVRAQAVWAVMADEGLIAPIAEGAAPSSRYAFLCHDEWDEGAGGEGPPAGDRFGIRTDQLALFLIAAQEARLAALEAAA